MDDVRYVLAVLLIVAWPPVFLTWLLVHPLIHFWRRAGPWLTYASVLLMWIGVGFTLFRLRGPLLAVDFGTRYALLVPAALVYALAVYVEISCLRRLPLRTLFGLPELAPDRVPQRLLTEGIYARMRHPRYVGRALVLLALALVVNYLAVYVLFVLFLPFLHGIVRLEERELRERFGEEWERYARRVPRFVPRIAASR